MFIPVMPTATKPGFRTSAVVDHLRYELHPFVIVDDLPACFALWWRFLFGLGEQK